MEELLLESLGHLASDDDQHVVKPRDKSFRTLLSGYNVLEHIYPLYHGSNLAE